MKKNILSFLIILWSTIAIGQEKYFQQKVNTKIEVELDDEKHVLSGNEEIVYTNNSNQKLDSIVIHLWPNAYKNSHTELAMQKFSGGAPHDFTSISTISNMNTKRS